MKVYAKLYCKKNRKKPDGTAPIYLVLRIKSKERLLATGKSINPDHWDQKAETVVNPVKYNKLMSILTKEKVKLNDIIIDIQQRQGLLTFDNIINEYHKGSRNEDFLEFAFTELENLKPGMKRKTHEDYYYSLQNLKEYRPTLSFNEITSELLIHYDVWLKSIKKRNDSSRYHNFTAIRKFINLAISYGLTNNYPFRNFKIRVKSEKAEVIYLTEKEVKKLEELLYSNTLGERHYRTLCNFLFTCYTGISGQELRNGALNVNGESINFVRSKTNKPVKVPITSYSRKLLPVVKENKLKKHYYSVNQDLTEIMEIAKINKYITYHCGRHTFAIISLMKGISLSVISKVLGHTTTKTTEIYAKVVDELMSKEMAKWDE